MTEAIRQYAGMSALAVDDDPGVRITIRRMLERLGFEVVVAADGDSALGEVRRRTFDLVITDLSMPGKSGIDFMREAQAGGLTAPVIVLTATGSVQAAVEAIKSGAFEFIEKPVRSDRLAEIVGAAMASASSKAHRTKSLQLDIEVEGMMAAGNTRQELPRPADESGSVRSVCLDADIEAPSPRPASGPPGPPLPPAGARPLRGSKPPPPPPRGGFPRNVGRYQVLGRIGRGGMGVVYKCHDPLLSRTVAVKVLTLVEESPEHRKEMSDRFKREAAAAASLTHPCIVAVHDLGRDDDMEDWFIVMELLEGQGLNIVIEQKGHLSVDETVALGFQMADALSFAHANKVVHRDIKPSNVLVQPSGSAKLLDFGLASLEGWNVTVAGRVFGSPSYMAPERIRGLTGGMPADQFSLGVVLYEVVTGKNPFESGSAEGRLRRVLTHNPPALASVEPSVPVSLSLIVERMMAKEESGRYGSMEDVADAFLLLGHDCGMEFKRHLATPRT